MIHSYLVWFLWWLRHGAIGPIEATCLGWVSTDLNTEFTHFNLVIRLSKVKQVALRFTSLLGLSRCSCGPRVPRRNACLSEWSRSELPETSFFVPAASAFDMIHGTRKWRQQACPFPAGVVSLVSGEVKHVVHLIRWNLKAVYANWGKTWPRSRQGNTARPLGFLGTESCLTFLLFPFFHQLVPIGP